MVNALQLLDLWRKGRHGTEKGGGDKERGVKKRRSQKQYRAGRDSYTLKERRERKGEKNPRTTLRCSATPEYQTWEEVLEQL